MNMNTINPLRIFYVNVIENNAGWGAEGFINRGLRALGHQTHCLDFRKHRQALPEYFAKAPPYDVFFLQRGDSFPLELVRSAHGPRLFWASELVERCRDQDPLLQSNLFDHVFFHSQRCIEQAVSQGWLDRPRCSVLLNGFDEQVHRPLPGIEQSVDILFVGTVTPRRRHLLDRLKSRFPITIVSAFGEELVRFFNRARMVLNLHAEESGDVETRVFEALGCGAFLLSEKLSAENPFDGRHLVESDSFDDLCRKIDFYLTHAEERKRIASQGHAEALARHTYTRRAAEITEIMTACLRNERREPQPDRVFSIHPGPFQTGSNRLGFQPALKPVPATNNGSLPANGPEKPLRIFAAFSQTNWEDYNLQPGLAHYGEVVRYDWKNRFDQYDPQWHWGQKQRMNLELLDYLYRAHRQKPIDLFFGYLSGRLIFPGFIHTVSRLNIPSLNICLDDQVKFWGELEPTGYSGMADIASAFTLCWTTEKSALDHYRTVGADVVYLPPAADPDFFNPLELPKTIDVLFIGQKYGRRGAMVQALRDQGIAVQTHGTGWENGPVSLPEMVRLFNQSKIVLGIGLVNDSTERVGLKGRDFEAPMTGALYLTQFNPDLKDFFALDREIVCYHSIADLVEKIKYYLARPREAESIRQAARARSVREHTWVRRFHEAFNRLKQIINQPASPAEAAAGRFPDSPGNPAFKAEQKDSAQALPQTAGPPRAPSGRAASDPPAETRDDWTYYLRANQKAAGSKKEMIKAFVLVRPDIRSILDIGCNTGVMSAQFMEHGLDVLGLDSSDNLRFPQGYRFLRCDIAATNAVFTADCILFLSLYHHLFRSRGPEFSDRLFLKLLLRSRYLIFDCGNPDEQGPDRQAWAGVLKKLFRSEKELLDHFGVPYQVIGAWPAGGAFRSIAVFQNETFDSRAKILDELRRPIGGRLQNKGLTSVNAIRDAQPYFQKTRFYQLAFNGRRFFAKKHLSPADEASELDNICKVYAVFPREELLEFYGRSGRFGLIFEWQDDFEYLDKVRDQVVHGVRLHDADRIRVAGRVKYIDFWSDPLQKTHERAKVRKCESARE